ncbi:MAG: hypothetical protein LBR80_05350 [Deltaproteobacteria bacterium]|jgi:hypothetical protein|nr:hypothetical protein [Deltaproteobacteria bacterium]
MLKKILLVLLLFFLAILSALGLLLLAWLLQWSPWMALAGPALFLLVPFFWYVGRLVSSVFARRRYAESVLGRGTGLPEAAGEGSVLRRDWERGIRALRPPDRSLPSNPVKDFPWFLVAGPQGAGRHGILRGAGAPLDPDPAAPLEGPEGCSWYFFDKAVYVAVRGLFDPPPPPAGPAASHVTGPGTLRPGDAAGQGPGGAEDMRAGMCALLRETGRRVPLQGVVAAVPAALLRPDRETELRDLAFQTGRLFDDLADVLDFSPPLYVFVTGLHLEPGWEASLERLSAEGAVLGTLFGQQGTDESRAAEAAGAIRSEIRDLTVEALELEPERIAPFLAASWAAEGLQRPLSVLCGAFRNPSPDAVPVRLAGILVSLPQVPPSERPHAGPASAGPDEVSVQLASGGAASPGRAVPGYGSGQFPSSGVTAGAGELAATANTAAAVLAAQSGFAAASVGPEEGAAAPQPGRPGAAERLLAETLPGMGNLSRRLNRAGGRRQRGYVGWIAGFYLVLAILAFLIAENVHFQRGASGEAASLDVALAAAMPADGPNSAGGQAALERADAAIYLLTRLEAFRGGTAVRGIGPDPAGDLNRRLEAAFTRDMEEATSEVSAAIDRQLDTVRDPDSDLFSFTFRQLLLLYSAYSGSMGELGKTLGMDVEEIFLVVPDGLDLAIHPLWNYTYARLLSVLVERSANGPIKGDRSERILKELNDAVDRAMELRGDRSFGWLMAWSERTSGASPITIAEFWAPYYSAEEIAALLPRGVPGQVRGACTARGRAFIMEALRLISLAEHPERGGAGASPASDFARDHDQACLAEWRDFNAAFSGPVATNLLSGAGLKDFRGLHIGSGGSPGARAAAVMSDNLDYLKGDPAAPVWYRNLALGLLASRWSAAKEDWREAKDPLRKARALGPISRAVREQMEDVYYRTDFVKRVYEAEKEFTSYRTAIEAILASLSDNPEDAFRLAARNYGGPAAAPAPAAPAGAAAAPVGEAADAPFNDARDSLSRYAAQLYRDAGDYEPDDFVFRIRTSELGALESVLVDTAARTLDGYWESDVILPAKFLSDAEVREAMYGKDGLILKFLSGRAAPFLDSRGPAGYSPRVWEGRPFPFTEDFLRLASQGGGPVRDAPADSYAVNISMTAALAGDGALEKPQRTVVTVRTPEAADQMINYNYPSSHVFTWKPGSAAEASVEIDLPSVSLMVSWDGPDGFPNFLNDLVSQNFELYPQDFPDHRAQLEALGISKIRVLMRADGALPVIRYLNLPRTALPVSIVSVGREQ